jgi:L-amino acid N-acyltransferase YncA
LQAARLVEAREPGLSRKTKRAGRSARALGFREAGVYRRHARRDGEWRDCVIVELLLDVRGSA